MGVTSKALTERTAGRTVPRAFLDQVRKRPEGVALRWLDGEAWREWTWSDYADRAARLAGSLAEGGIGPGDRVVLMLRNSPEFHVADMAALLVGATPVSIYNSSSADQVAFIAGNCGARAALVEDAGYLEKVLTARTFLPELRHVAAVDGAAVTGDVLAWDELVAHDPIDLEAAARVARPSDLATVIYTSGTTGPPKGVMIDHANIAWTVSSLRLALGDLDPEGSRAVSYLPMAHIAERMTSHYMGIELGYEVTTCPEASAVSQYLPQVRPQMFFAVPRVWEKIEAGVRAALGADSDRAEAFEQALDIGGRVAEHRARGAEIPAELGAAFEQADAAGLRPVRELLGLDQLISAISGAAPISRGVFEFFRALGIPLSEIYGLSETSGPMTWDPSRVRSGTVGRAIPGEDVRLATDGEVVCRGGNIFRGYLDEPTRTAEVLDAVGWFHTGDIGELDEAGYLRIVDRKKELIITAGGKNISPANLEAALKSHPLVGQVCVIGDGRPFISALLVLDPEAAPVWASTHGVEVAAASELAEHPEIRAELERAVAGANEHFSRVEQVKRFVVLCDEWLPDSEELTPTMKLKRRGVHAKYADEIESMYR
ncbi:MAG TPA: AMP-dependent synthetase/ligase [Acidimicrobiia bacterium]|nr:AMP-dependent synthetase/ligase [Acidimicrobiia bacterium]